LTGTTTPPSLVVHKIAALNWFVNNQPKAHHRTFGQAATGRVPG
jgi:hypothetical protein